MTRTLLARVCKQEFLGRRHSRFSATEQMTRCLLFGCCVSPSPSLFGTRQRTNDAARAAAASASGRLAAPTAKADLAAARAIVAAAVMARVAEEGLRS